MKFFTLIILAFTLNFIAFPELTFASTNNNKRTTKSAGASLKICSIPKVNKYVSFKDFRKKYSNKSNKNSTEAKISLQSLKNLEKFIEKHTLSKSKAIKFLGVELLRSFQLLLNETLTRDPIDIAYNVDLSSEFPDYIYWSDLGGDFRKLNQEYENGDFFSGFNNSIERLISEMNSRPSWAVNNMIFQTFFNHLFVNSKIRYNPAEIISILERKFNNIPKELVDLVRKKSLNKKAHPHEQRMSLVFDKKTYSDVMEVNNKSDFNLVKIGDTYFSFPDSLVAVITLAEILENFKNVSCMDNATKIPAKNVALKNLYDNGYKQLAEINWSIINMNDIELDYAEEHFDFSSDIRIQMSDFISNFSDMYSHLP